MKVSSPLFSIVAVVLAASSLVAQQFPTSGPILGDAAGNTAYDAPGNPWSVIQPVDPDLVAASCLSDLLNLGDVVRCHPASRYLELRFDLSQAQVEGPTIFEVYHDSIWITNISVVADAGTLFIHNNYVGKTITLSQAGETGCSRAFTVPACTESVCPLGDAGDVIPMACDGGMVQYRFAMQHDPPIEISTTDFAVYDEKGDFLTIYSLAETDSLVHLFVPATVEERQYSLCDLFNPEGCCAKVVLPGIDCNSVPTDVVDLAELGVRVFPNPVSDHLDIDLGDGINIDAGIAYRISSSTGQLMDAGVLTQRTTRLMAEAFPSGLFVLQLYAGQSLVAHRRFLKIR